MFHLPPEIKLACSAPVESVCCRYAVAEVQRLLRRIGISSTTVTDAPLHDCYYLRLLIPETDAPLPPLCLPDQFLDGFILRVSEVGITLSSRTAKGILNAVYDLAELLGFLFLYPGEEGEWAPSTDGAGFSVSLGERIINPRFKFRGIFGGCGQGQDYSEEEWLRYYAKLKFNAVANRVTNRELAEELGMRLEAGGHGLVDLLPRELFDVNPELFRMVQPEDFYGERNKDFNCCITHPEAKRILQENYQKRLDELESYHALHAWPEDLPGGGWCYCPSCRSLSPSDQAVLAMRHLSEVILEGSFPMRVPVLAYHDTILPGKTIDVMKEMFLLYAPRERCYAHALNEEGCARNRLYLQALKEWKSKFDGIDDAHTFEYFFDQILFRGLYPFIPGVILKDMGVYEAAGIESHLSLQVGGPVLAPEFNMLVFARGLWDESLRADVFIEKLACQILSDQPHVWRDYLTRRAEIFAQAMQFCDHSLDIYLDYRWLPESTNAFATRMAEVYAQSAAELEVAAEDLRQAGSPSWPDRAQALAEREVARARCEAAELKVMSFQQQAGNHLGQYFNGGRREELETGLRALQDALGALASARELLDRADLPEGAYHRGINRWLEKEFREKIMRWEMTMPSD